MFLIFRGFAILFWIVFYLSFVRDRSSYRNCLLLFLALISSVPACCSFTGVHALSVFALSFLVFTLAILVVPFFLIINGIVMLHREGLSLANMLSLLLGLLIGIGEIATLIAGFSPLLMGLWPQFDLLILNLSIAGLFISATVIYGSMSFLMFMLYTILLMIIPRKRDYDYVIIHGAGLLEGNRISRLLADRLDKAIEVYRKDPTPPILIPSGGKGADETCSESEAMAGYLRDQGIPPQDILMEDRSTSTYENLVRSMDLIHCREGRKYTALVTSNYHVYRALRYCRKLGFACTGIGSRVAPYYWPSALIREYVAIHFEKKHAIIFLAGWILWLAAVFFCWISMQ